MRLWVCKVLFFSNVEVVESFKVVLYEASVLEWVEWLTISVKKLETK